MKELEAEHHILPQHYENLSARFSNIVQLLQTGEDSEAKALLKEMHYADLADLIDNSNYKIHQKIIQLMGNDFPADTLVWLSEGTKSTIEKILSPSDLANFIDQLDIEDAIETIEGFSEDTQKQLIEFLPRDKRNYIVEGFTYKEYTAGRIMEKQFIALPDHWSVGQAIDYIRRCSISHNFYAPIVIDSKQRPLGNVLLSTLIQSSRNTHVKDIMIDDFKIADTNTDLEQLSYIFKQYELTIVPVTNQAGKLVGTVSINSMLYIVEQQIEENVMHLSGISVKDTFHSIIQTIKHRFPWLFINLITASLTSVVINQFTDTIMHTIALAAIMPIVASVGGTAGTQVMTVTVMALADNDIAKSNSFNIIKKELLVCCCNGLMLAIIASCIMFLTFSYIKLSLVLGASIMINFMFAGFLGSFIPITLDRFNIDPAVVSAVFLNALTDALGFLTFLTLAYIIIIL